MTSEDEVFEFATEPVVQAEPWNVLIVDDEPAVHEVTRLVLGNFRFEDRPLKFHNAYSAAQARELLRSVPDLAVVLLDVVMESDQAGLELIKFIRSELDNHFVRIVLRTGQPGQAPEHEVITNYDINDYKDKTELTAQKLRTMMYSTLRAYRDVMQIERNRQGLERVIAASAHVFSFQKSHEFASAVLEQLGNVVGLARGALYCKPVERKPEAGEELLVAAATGDYSSFVNQPVDVALPKRIVDSVRRAYERKENLFAEDHYVLHFTDSHSTESLLYVGETPKLRDVDYKLIQLFCTNVSIAFENLHLNQELFESQLEMVYLLAGAAETRSRETANHVRRVGLISELLGLAIGMDPQEAAMLRFAAPLHDIGKIGIPDAILNKTGPHTPEESAIMRTHAELGAQMLAASRRPLMQMAALVAREHHENWDGSGYPRGLREEQISLAGRIVALADVYDALGSNRCYKKAWSSDEVQSFIRGQSGRKFDPRLVEALFMRWDEAESIRARLPD
jgi:response regulator RpfG family c-di-GMP phosphodiesterase